MTVSSRLPGFHRLTIGERIRALRAAGLLSSADEQILAAGNQVLAVDRAERMIENVVGVYGLPLGVALNLTVDGRDYALPMVVEEPSIVAGLSAAARTARSAGGFSTEGGEPLLIGQIQVLGVTDPPAARNRLLERRREIIDLADSLQPDMVARGGGMRDVEVHVHPSPSHGDMLVVHLLVDTRDAMGANQVNTLCEGVAPLVESITGGEACLRILSNLADRALVRAWVRLSPADCAGRGDDGERVCRGIVAASELAMVDRYRATTHNKGIMNGIDAVALATGNDWRAIEAAAHAHAARDGHYRGLSRWHRDSEGGLVGELELPLKVGIVGGNLQSNPAVAVNLGLLGAKSAGELARVMAAAGLAQNFAALRALVTQGIQHGHMTLHARSVAATAGATPALFERVVHALVESREIKVRKAQAIIESLQAADIGSGTEATAGHGARTAGHGKIIIIGEHAAVYGSHVLAAPIPLAVEATVEESRAGVELIIPQWGVERRLSPEPEQRHPLEQPISLILEHLGLSERGMRIEVFPHLPRAMGLGCSAAVAVSVIRGVDQCFSLGLSDEAVNALAYECEKLAHTNPSGVDNQVATYNRPLLYQRGEPSAWKTISPPKGIPMVIGITGVEGLTATTVANVRQAWERDPARYERIFGEIDALAMEAVQAMEQYDLQRLGECMNFCHGLLNTLGVSSRELEDLVALARASGAVGAKLTGGGGGGSMIALCPGNSARVVEAMQRAGYQAMEIEVG